MSPHKHSSRSIAALAIAVMLLLFTSPAQAQFIPVPDKSLPKIVATHKGNIVLVNFWATWCSPCRTELPHLLQLEKDFAKDGFKLIIISADEPEQEPDATRFLDSINAPYPRYIKKSTDNDTFINIIDTKWSGALPATFIYDRRGKRIQSFFGEVEFTKLKQAVQSALKNGSPK